MPPAKSSKTSKTNKASKTGKDSKTRKTSSATPSVVTLNGNQLRLGERLGVSFHRTLRLPEDGKRYPLPPSLGQFPVHLIDDYRSAVPEAWRDHQGLFLPMYQSEAMWMSFSAPGWHPVALKVGVGKICALSGERYNERLHGEGDGTTQNYVVAPTQPWLDGINNGDGTVSQFVAMPLGSGVTVEGQVSGKERYGGVQLCAFEAKARRFSDEPPVPWERPPLPSDYVSSPGAAAVDFSIGSPPPPSGPPAPMAMPPEAPGQAPPVPSTSRASRLVANKEPVVTEMGVAAGGSMEQKIYPDPHGVDTWNQRNKHRVYVHIVNSEVYRQITGRPAPATPVNALAYTQYGLPWYSLYDEAAGDIAPSDILKDVKSVKELEGHIEPTVHIPGYQVKTLKGDWPK